MQINPKQFIAKSYCKQQAWQRDLQLFLSPQLYMQGHDWHHPTQQKCWCTDFWIDRNHRGWNKMADIWQTISSSAFSWNNMFELGLTFEQQGDFFQNVNVFCNVDDYN